MAQMCRFETHFRNCCLHHSSEIDFSWMPVDPFNDDKWTLVQAMAWCREAMNQYPNHCWPRSILQCMAKLFETVTVQIEWAWDFVTWSDLRYNFIQVIIKTGYLCAQFSRQPVCYEHVCLPSRYADQGLLSGLTLILAWLCNHTPSKMWDEIIYPVPNLNGCTVEIWKLKSNNTLQFIWWM